MKRNKFMTALMLLGVIDAQEQGLVAEHSTDQVATSSVVEHVRDKDVPSPIYCKPKSDGSVACLELAHFHVEAQKIDG